MNKYYANFTKDELKNISLGKFWTTERDGVLTVISSKFPLPIAVKGNKENV